MPARERRRVLIIQFIGQKKKEKGKSRFQFALTWASFSLVMGTPLCPNHKSLRTISLAWWKYPPSLSSALVAVVPVKSLDMPFA
jgi:hypothetical protein